MTDASQGPDWGARARDWAEVQEQQFDPARDALMELAGIGPGTAHLDAGCGAGGALRAAADRGAAVSGFDASEAMLAVAAERVPAARLVRADLEAPPFADASFDVVTGFNAFQFAADPARALAEARRMARPGGTVVAMTWAEPEGMEAARLTGALAPLRPAPEPGAPGPFVLSTERALRDVAARAGLGAVAMEEDALHWTYADEAEALRGLGSSGPAAEVARTHGRAAVEDAYRAALAPFARPGGGYRIEARWRALIARA